MDSENLKRRIVSIIADKHDDNAFKAEWIMNFVDDMLETEKLKYEASKRKREARIREICELAEIKVFELNRNISRLESGLY